VLNLIFLATIILPAIAAIITGILISETKKRAVWKFSLFSMGAIFVIILLLLPSASHGSFAVIPIFIPLVVFSFMYLLVHYLRILYKYLKQYSVVLAWISVVVIFTFVAFLCALPSINTAKRDRASDMRIYQSFPLIGETLSDYQQSADVPTYDDINIIEFTPIIMPQALPQDDFNQPENESAVDAIIPLEPTPIIIPLPFDVADKEVFAKEGLIIFMEGRVPIFAIFDNRASNKELPEMDYDYSNSMDTIFSRAIVRYSHSKEGYAQQKEYLNTVPRVNKKGVPNGSDMYSPEILYKRELAHGFTNRSMADLKIINVIFDNPEINGFLYQRRGYQFVEVYKNDLYFFTFFIFSSEQSGGYLDYILTYLSL